MKYAVAFEKTPDGVAAHVPDLPGCVAVADTLEETTELIREAIMFHLEGLPIPEPTTQCDYVVLS